MCTIVLVNRCHSFIFSVRTSVAGRYLTCQSLRPSKKYTEYQADVTSGDETVRGQQMQEEEEQDQDVQQLKKTLNQKI